MAFQTIRLEIENRIATLTLTRASSGNSIDESLASELREACAQLRQDDDVWVVVLTGEGDAFCRGADLSTFTDQNGSVLDNLRSLKVSESVAAIEKPVIAALNGDAIDQGLELALACDMRIASEQASFGLTHVEHGLMPWDGGTQRLPRLIGRGAATEMILTSRIMDAQEALDIGLVNEIAEPDRVLEQARQTASTIAGHGPIAARYLKELVLKGLDMTLEQGLRLEADLNFILQSTSDRAEGIGSFLERRGTPQFRGQ